MSEKISFFPKVFRLKAEKNTEQKKKKIRHCHYNIIINRHTIFSIQRRAFMCWSLSLRVCVCVYMEYAETRFSCKIVSLLRGRFKQYAYTQILFIVRVVRCTMCSASECNEIEWKFRQICWYSDEMAHIFQTFWYACRCMPQLQLLYCHYYIVSNGT